MLSQLLAEDGVDEICHLAGRVGVMALHGGLEAGTWEAARECAGRIHASRYAVIQPDHLRWHVPSVKYSPRDSRCLRRFLTHVGLAVSFHGYGRRGLEHTVLVGGSNRRVAESMATAIIRTGVARVLSDVDAMPAGLRGLHPKNPVNLPAFGGVQLELPSAVRGADELSAIAAAAASVLAAEQRTLCTGPS